MENWIFSFAVTLDQFHKSQLKVYIFFNETLNFWLVVYIHLCGHILATLQSDWKLNMVKK